MSFLPSKVIQGIKANYIIIKHLDKGSFGNVYVVRNESDNQQYVLKVQTQMKEDEKQFIHYLIQNYQNFDCFTRFYEIFTFNLSQCVIQEYCQGGNLYSHMIRTKLDKIEIKRIIQHICRAFRQLNSIGMFHRDIKPENILISRDPIQNRNIYKLCDCGEIRKTVDNNALLKTQNVGTPYYQAPEVILGNQYDYKVDIWSLGVMLYEFYKNVPLFDGATPFVIQEKILKEDLRVRNGKIDNLDLEPQIKGLIKSMVDPDPNCRPNIDIIEKTYGIEPQIDFQQTLKVSSVEKQFQGPIPQIIFKQPQYFNKPNFSSGQVWKNNQYNITNQQPNFQPNNFGVKQFVPNQQVTQNQKFNNFENIQVRQQNLTPQNNPQFVPLKNSPASQQQDFQNKNFFPANGGTQQQDTLFQPNNINQQENKPKHKIVIVSKASDKKFQTPNNEQPKQDPKIKYVDSKPLNQLDLNDTIVSLAPSQASSVTEEQIRQKDELLEQEKSKNTVLEKQLQDKIEEDEKKKLEEQKAQERMQKFQQNWINLFKKEKIQALIEIIQTPEQLKKGESFFLKQITDIILEECQKKISSKRQ